jgi:hypothetical protein
MFGTIGWLFADLMLALAMAFLVATTVGQPPPPKAAPAPTTARPSTTAANPPNEPVLELNPVSLKVLIDWQALLGGDPVVTAALQQQIQSEAALAGRRAGLVLTFGGASGGKEGLGKSIAERVNSVLTELGGQGFVFNGAVYRAFIDTGAPQEELTIDVYLFKV